MIHELKIDPKYYCRVADGSKTFEVRENDRGYQSGDTVILKEYDRESINPTTKAAIGYTESPQLEFTIGYIYPLGGDRVIFSLLPPKNKKQSKK